MWMDRGRTQAVLAKAVVLGAISFSGVVSVTAPASAQFFGPWFGPRAVPIERDEVIPPRLVARIVHAQGFRMTDYPSRRGDRIIALGVDDRGQVRRFVLDAYDGAIVNTSLIGAPRPPGYIGGDRGAYAYGAPDIDQPIEAAPKPKRKPKVKTAAKHPAPLPQAAPASPEAPPSQATQAPPSVAPAPSTPAAAVPAATPAPPVAATPPATPPAATPVAPAAAVSARSQRLRSPHLRSPHLRSQHLRLRQPWPMHRRRPCAPRLTRSRGAILARRSFR